MKIVEKKLRKMFSVRVSARKYNGWKHSPLFPKLGGLYGLMIGAKFKREITAKVLFKKELPDRVLDNVLDILEKAGYEIESKSVMRANDPYYWKYAVYWTVEEFTGDTDDEISDAAKKFCRELKEDIVEEVAGALREAIEEFLRYADIYEDVVEELKEIGVVRA